MTSTIEALQNLYVAKGGTLSDVADLVTIPDMINALAALPSESSTGAELPTVTGEDNGKVLGVVNGEWAAMALPEELPAVSASNNGQVLKVVDGAWAVGSDLTE